MSTTSYISTIERYYEYRCAIHDIMASILTGVAEEELIQNKTTRINAMQSLGKRFVAPGGRQARPRCGGDRGAAGDCPKLV